MSILNCLPSIRIVIVRSSYRELYYEVVSQLLDIGVPEFLVEIWCTLIQDGDNLDELMVMYRKMWYDRWLARVRREK